MVLFGATLPSPLRTGTLILRLPSAVGTHFLLEFLLVNRFINSGRVGGDGFAIWLVKEQAQLGPVFGSQPVWDGLGIIFDTYDNDGRVRSKVCIYPCMLT